MIDITKSCIKSLGVRPSIRDLNFSRTYQFLCAQTIIRAFYAILAFFCLKSLDSWTTHLSKIYVAPLWPVFWLNHIDTQTGITAILVFYLISGILALTAIRWRVARVAIFFASLEYLAFTNSFGKINHGSHLQILLCFLLIFLPTQWNLEKPRKDIQVATLMIFSGCQAIIMLTYTMSGFFKLLYIPIQAMRNQVHSLMPEALALQIAHHLLKRDEISVLGEWFIDHHLLAWPLLIGTIYLQFFAFWVAFRPSLHQIWGFNLILFHLATGLTMTVSFWQNCLWLTLFFLNSPFRPKSYNFRKIIRDLPLISLVLNKKLVLRANTINRS